MSVGFLAPQFLWALLALPLVVVLHFLRTRRRPHLVSALFLWRKAREAADDRRRTSPTWLLLLQLLFAALAALALARPLVSFEGRPDRVVVIDASASMTARAPAGTRLDEARSVAEELMAGSGRVALVRAGLEAGVSVPLTAERIDLRRALQAFEAGDRDADLVRALALAHALVPEGEVHLISDGPSPPARGFFYHPVGARAVNYGITTFDSSLGQAYVAVTSNDPRPQEIPVELVRDGSVLARTTLLVPAMGQSGVTFPVAEADGFIAARLQVPPQDALALDDVAYAGQRRLTVAVGEESASVTRALQSLSGIEYRVTVNAGEVTADARVLFGVADDELPPGNVLVFRAAAEEPRYLAIRDWDQSDSLLRFVDLRDVVVGISPEAPSEDEPGWETLARAANLTPVLSRRRNDDGTVIRASFHPSQTDLVLRPAFPAFMANAMNEFRGLSTVPLGATVGQAVDAEGRTVGRILAPGVYRLPDGTDDGTNAGMVAASLLSAGETRLPSPEAAPARAAERTGDSSETVSANRGLALWLALAAAALLLLEWIAWSRGATGWLRGN
ncbi:MAG: VWA domain-containing protein [Trueperaceae bacterium]